MTSFAELWGEGPLVEEGKDATHRDLLAHLRMIKPQPDCGPRAPRSDAQRDFIKAGVLHLVSLGVPPTAVCGVLNIAWNAVKAWAKADATFEADLHAARESGNEMLADQLMTTHERHLLPAMAKVEADNTKWLLGVRDRNTYGAKVEVTDSGSAGLIDVLKLAIARIPRPETAQDLPALDLERGDFTEVIDIQELLS